jgi:general secretion pathway protein K
VNARQRGIALLTAIILVAVAAIVATSIAWQSQLAARRGIAVFTVAQSLAVAKGAEAMAAYALKDNLQKNPKTTAPNQPWAKPYGPVEMDAGVVLEASLEDQSGKFNLNSVVMPAGAGGTQLPGTAPVPSGTAAVPPDSPPAPGGAVALVENKDALNVFVALLTDLKINTDYAARLVDWIDSDDQPTFPGGAEDSFYLAQQPPHRTLNMPLTSVSELLAMGMDRASYDRLAPLVTALPVDTKFWTPLRE